MAKVNTLGDGTFEEAVAGTKPEFREMAAAARELLADVMPGVTEVPWVRQRTVGYGVGPKKMSEHFCYIAPQAKHVNLGFMYGADLDDPTGLLEGGGKALRHVKLRSMDDVTSPARRHLVEQASKHLPKLR